MAKLGGGLIHVLRAKKAKAVSVGRLKAVQPRVRATAVHAASLTRGHIASEYNVQKLLRSGSSFVRGAGQGRLKKVPKVPKMKHLSRSGGSTKAPRMSRH